MRLALTNGVRLRLSATAGNAGIVWRQTGAAEKVRALVADQLAQFGKDRAPTCGACPILVATGARELVDAAPIWKHCEAAKNG